MAASPAESLLTPEDLLALEDGPSYELLDGKLVERPVSLGSSVIASIINQILGLFVRTNNLGVVCDSELGMRIFPNTRRVRKADVSFLAAARVPAEDQGFLLVAPDLVVEVLSPNDVAQELRAKVDEWLSAGVKLVWVAVPISREVHVYRAAGHPSILTATDDLSGEDVVPGFACKVAELFPAR